MKIKLTPNFLKLKKRLTGLAAIDLIQLAPEYVNDFINHNPTGKLSFNPLPSKVSNNLQFQKWRTICTDLWDFEFHQHRLLVCIQLLKMKNPSSISDGEWLDHQFSYWAVLTKGLMSKFEKLCKSTNRKISTPKLSRFELNEMLRKLSEYQTRLKVIRDPIAHPGGPVRIIGDDDNLGPFIIFRGEYDTNSIMKGMTNFYPKWTSESYRFTNMVLREIEEVSKSLLTNLPKITG